MDFTVIRFGQGFKDMSPPTKELMNLVLEGRIAHGGKVKAVDSKLYSLLHDEPNPEMTSFVFRETLMTHLLLWGNAYAQIVRNMRGEIVGLYPLMPDRMTVGRDEKGALYYDYTCFGDENQNTSPGTVRLSPREVLHIPGLGFDGLVEYLPIAMAWNAVGMGLAVEEFEARFFEKGERKLSTQVQQKNLFRGTKVEAKMRARVD